MTILKNKTKVSTIAFVLLLTMAVALVALPAVTTQETTTVYPWPYINAIPNPVGVGQEVLLHIGCQWPAPSIQYGWEGLWVTIEKPDGTTETIENIRTDATGGTGRVYVPAKVGTYYLQTHFPEQVVPRYPQFGFEAAPPPGATMEESESEVLELVVQEEPVPTYPGRPLPTEYWTRPIDAQIREWSPIAGNWLGHQVSMDPSPPAQTLYKDYNEYAPETAHVLWAKPITMGGLAGGQMGEQGFEQGDAYEPKWTGAVIIGGVVFYNQFETTGSETGLERTVVAVDIHTGEELWNKPLLDLNGNNRNLDFGQVFYWDSYNYHGVFDFLWTTVGSTWNAYDPFSGRWVYTMQGVPSGPMVYGPKGEIYIYTVNTGAGWMTLWNSSRVVSDAGSWNPQGNVYDAGDTADGIEWEVTIPTGLPGSVDKVREGIILGTNFDKYSLSDNYIVMWAISTKPRQEGTLLYNRTFAIPFLGHYDVQDADVESDVFCVSVAESAQHWGFNLSTGEKLWGPTEPQHYTDNWGYSSSNSWDIIADGKYISGSYGGTVWCRNVTTGETLWTYDIEDPYTEVLHNNRWRFRPAFVADGKLYIENTEHNPFDPQHRGAPFICLDLETGDLIFRIPYRGGEWSSTPIIGDSIIAMYNNYDQRIYAIGKGPSATTVSIQNDVITNGQSVLIKGMVTDESPGTKDYALTARFPNGVPAIADEYMSDWMLYVYNQFPRPADVTGVEVTLDAVDPNGTWIHIGTVTSDSSGLFKKMWTPPDEGEYTIIATFPGSKSYYASYAQTGLGVGPEPPAPPQAAEAPAYTAIDLAIIAAVAVVAILVLYTLYTVRKQRK